MYERPLADRVELLRGICQQVKPDAGFDPLVQQSQSLDERQVRVQHDDEIQVAPRGDVLSGSGAEQDDPLRSYLAQNLNDALKFTLKQRLALGTLLLPMLQCFSMSPFLPQLPAQPSPEARQVAECLGDHLKVGPRGLAPHARQVRHRHLSDPETTRPRTGQELRVDHRPVRDNRHVVQDLAPEQLEAAVNVVAQVAEQHPHQRVPAKGVELADEMILPLRPVAGDDVCPVEGIQEQVEEHGERLAAEGEICWGAMHSWKEMVKLLERVGRPQTLGFQCDMAHTMLYLLGYNAPDDRILPQGADLDDVAVLDAGLKTLTEALRPWTIDFHVAQNDGTVHGSGSHDKTGRHCLPNDPNGKLDIPRHAGLWLRDADGELTKAFRHVCWDGCMFPNDVMMQPETWNGILAAMVAVRDAHGWCES